MGQITIEIPQKLNRTYRLVSENSAQEVLSNLDTLVKRENFAGQDLGLADDNEAATRNKRMEWLKANREKHAGHYVALDGDKLVGTGKTIREANEQARQNGIEKPFLVRVSSENEILSGGW
ncbi:MAG: DUF5678 domain-containing protein [Pyrinomonadaceae bacterium]